MVLQPFTGLSLLLLALAGFSGGSEVKSFRQSIAITPRAGEPAVDAYDLLLMDVGGGGGGGGGAGFPSHNDGEETLLYPTLASTSSTPVLDIAASHRRRRWKGNPRRRCRRRRRRRRRQTHPSVVNRTHPQPAPQLVA